MILCPISEPLLEFNPNHEPAGSPVGGQFASKEGAGAAWPLADDAPRTLTPEMEKQVQGTGEAWLAKISPVERQAVYDYRHETFNEINPALWDHPETLSADAQLVQQALDKAPVPPPPALVWRMVGPQFQVHVAPGPHEADKIAEGDEIQLNGFQSSTINPALIDRLLKSYAATILEIKPSKGAYVDVIPKMINSDEKEFLLPHGARYRVRGQRQVPFATKQGTRMVNVIQLEML